MPQPLNVATSHALSGIERSPITVLHLLIIAVCACGFAIDFVEVALSNALSAIFSAPPHALPAGQLAWLLSSVFLGAIVGAPIAGWIADRSAPRATLSVTMLWLAVTTLLAAVSPTPAILTMSRLLSGIALGAYPPLMMAYLTDILPVRRRGAAIFGVCAIAYLAPPIAIFTLRALTPIHPLQIEGWRWLFLGTAAICGLATGLSASVPEAPHWLASRGGPDPVERVATRFARSQLAFTVTMSAEPARRRDATATSSGLIAPGHAPAAVRQLATPRFLFLCLIYFLVPWAGGGFPLITGPILLARHIDLSDALLYIGLAAMGPVIGTVMGGAIVDHVGRRTVMVVCALDMMGALVAFSLGHSGIATAAALIAFGVGLALYMPAMTLYGAELFGPAVRSRSSAIAWACNRAAAAAAPLVLLPLVYAGRYGVVSAVFGVTLIAGILAVGQIGRFARGATAPLAA